jgi:hypothetical protein
MTTRDIGLIETKYVEQKYTSHLLIKDLCAYLNIFQSLTYCGLCVAQHNPQPS